MLQRLDTFLLGHMHHCLQARVLGLVRLELRVQLFELRLQHLDIERGPSCEDWEKEPLASHTRTHCCIRSRVLLTYPEYKLLYDFVVVHLDPRQKLSSSVYKVGLLAHTKQTLQAIFMVMLMPEGNPMNNRKIETTGGITLHRIAIYALLLLNSMCSMWRFCMNFTSFWLHNPIMYNKGILFICRKFWIELAQQRSKEEKVVCILHKGETMLYLQQCQRVQARTVGEEADPGIRLQYLHMQSAKIIIHQPINAEFEKSTIYLSPHHTLCIHRHPTVCWDLASGDAPPPFILRTWAVSLSRSLVASSSRSWYLRLVFSDASSSLVFSSSFFLKMSTFFWSCLPACSTQTKP